MLMLFFLWVAACFGALVGYGIACLMFMGRGWNQTRPEDDL